MNHCQICEREVKSKSGLIAHHGFKRPGNGWQTESCVGDRELPYEKSRDAIPKAILVIDSFVEMNNLKIKDLVENKPPISLFGNRVVQSTNPVYIIHQNNQLGMLKSEIAFALRDKERLEKRYQEWRFIVTP